MRAAWLRMAVVSAVVIATLATAATAADRKDGRPKGSKPGPAKRVVEGRGNIQPTEVVLTEDIQVATGNTPRLRLLQNASSGFTAQTWDVAGNEANFFVRDVTGGSRLPLRIRPGAPTSAIDIAASGHVGIGTAGPQAPLHLQSNEPRKIRIQRTGTTDPNAWDIGDKGNGTFMIDKIGAARVEVQVTGQGMFRVAPVKHPPTKDVAKGALYNDTSGALCWYSGKRWLKVVGPGSCK